MVRRFPAVLEEKKKKGSASFSSIKLLYKMPYDLIKMTSTKKKVKWGKTSHWD